MSRGFLGPVMDASLVLQQLPLPILNRLRGFAKVYAQAGWQCLLVGGSLRDLILGQIPKDFDFATNCPLEISRKLFKKVIPTGVEHGTLTIIFEGEAFEVTRFRKDIEHDGRRAKVLFAETWQEDQSRRDLTINALAYDLVAGCFLDSQGALDDFAKKRIRFVGKAATRVEEDHLRALRYLRMTARFIPFGFHFDPAELDEVVKIFDPNPLSQERILDEFKKIFAHPFEMSFLRANLPRLRLFRNIFDAATERACLISWLNLKNALSLAYYAVRAGQKTEPLRLQKGLVNLARLLASLTPQDLSQEVKAKELFSKTQPEDLSLLVEGVIEFFQIDLSSLLQRVKQGEPIYLHQLSLQAKDLMPLGYQGKALGTCLNQLLFEVWKSPQDNVPERLHEILSRQSTKSF